ncbi:MAG: AmmeMemoRadiSam system protein A [Terrimicrobiaceae bacterium]
MKYELEMEGTASSGSADQEKSVPSSQDTRATGVVCAVLMPHAPVLVPEVGEDRGRAADASCLAMSRAAEFVMAHRPEQLLVISPHSPRRLRAFGIWMEDPLEGSFAAFGAPRAGVSLPLDRDLVRAIGEEATARRMETWEIRHVPLDHGALVPLWFLAEAGWSGPTTIVSLSVSENDGLSDFGAVIAAAAEGTSSRLAIVASGDMSHRLRPNAPCGFHPQAHQFDETFIRLIQAGDYRKIRDIDPELRELAAEDAVDSTLIAAAAANWKTTGHQVLSYEGPFGVGYGVALLFSGNPASAEVPAAKSPGDKCEGSQLPQIARQSVEAALRGGRDQPPAPAGEYLHGQRGVFVTIRERGGQLRGCVGTIDATAPNIVVETWRNARLAALQNHRFSPVASDELDNLRFEVSVIHSQEDISSEAEMDPQRYGIIVSARDGRRGLLLPGIEEITTPAEQLSYARIKGGIDPGEPLTLQRFQVDHFEDPA